MSDMFVANQLVIIIFIKLKLMGMFEEKVIKKRSRKSFCEQNRGYFFSYGLLLTFR